MYIHVKYHHKNHNCMRAVPNYKKTTFCREISLKKQLAEVTPGQRCKKTRIEKGWTIKELSIKSGISAISISTYERGLRNPELRTIVKLANVLNISLAYLTDFDKLPENNLAEKVRKYRKLKGWSQKTLAKKANVDPTTIQKVEVGKTKSPIKRTLTKIEDALECKLS